MPIDQFFKDLIVSYAIDGVDGRYCYNVKKFDFIDEYRYRLLTDFESIVQNLIFDRYQHAKPEMYNYFNGDVTVFTIDDVSKSICKGFKYASTSNKRYNYNFSLTLVPIILGYMFNIDDIENKYKCWVKLIGQCTFSPKLWIKMVKHNQQKRLENENGIEIVRRKIAAPLYYVFNRDTTLQWLTVGGPMLPLAVNLLKIQKYYRYTRYHFLELGNVYFATIGESREMQYFVANMSARCYDYYRNVKPSKLRQVTVHDEHGSKVVVGLN